TCSARDRRRRHPSRGGRAMNILLLLIPISLVLLGIAIAAFVWAVKRGQFDDLDTPALDILEDDDRPAPPPAPAPREPRGS
ncbi:MAG: cbb3-type cytochrome oxidase assembly protein CcoS, partial [Cellulomonas iranensis]|nr:cbb3-type cytochrome oxidase assembly protein CcoS [Cellulomonas iranensis]